MDQKKINEIVELIKNNEETKKAFAILDDISKFLQKDKKFFNFAAKQAKKNYVSPMEMIMLAHDYLNNTGIYAKGIEKEASTAVTVKKTKDATITIHDTKKENELKALDISRASYDQLKEYIAFFKVKGKLIPLEDQNSLVKVSTVDQMKALIAKHNNKPSKANKVAKKVVKEETVIDNQIDLFAEGEL